MSRMLSSAFCVALLAVSAAAFALTEGAKTELSPIYGTEVDKVFSPTCNLHICARRSAEISFKVRGAQRLEVWVETDPGHSPVATLVTSRLYRNHHTVRLFFDGRSGTGALLPDALYLPVVRLLDSHRTITLPNPIQLDTVAPRILGYSHHLPRVISPTSLGAPHEIQVSYTLNGHAQAVLFANGRRVALTYRGPLRGDVMWSGRFDGTPAPAGTYAIELAARDAAGNQSRVVQVGRVRVAYLVLSAARIRVAPRARFAVRILVGPARLRWVFDRRRGTDTARRLALRAPSRRGRYSLYLSGGGHAAVVSVVVR